jgi:hypothetical protein
MEAVEKHFRETHKENIIKKLELHTLSGTAARSVRSPELARLVRSVWDDQRRFPLQIATTLSQQFATRGLQFFKVNRTITHVSIARPHYLDLEAVPVSEGVKKIVDFINAKPKCTRRQLMDALAPAPLAPAVLPVAPDATAGPAPAVPEPTAEQTAVVSDLHWLIHQGHVIEFANGTLETAKKPAPKPPRPEPKTPAPAEGQPTEPDPAGVVETPSEGSVEALPGSVPADSVDTTEIVRPAEDLGEGPAAVQEPPRPEPLSEPAVEVAPSPVESPS